MKFFFRLALKIFLASLPLAFVNAFSVNDIISPVEGTFANIQPLVLHEGEGEELYYTISASDPLEEGLSYDGPVVINQTGEIVLKIACITSSGRSDFEVRYNVIPQVFSTANARSASFIQDISENPLVEYHAGNSFDFCDGFLYYINGSKESSTLKNIFLSEANTLERYVSVRVQKDAFLWNFVLCIRPSEKAPLLSDLKREVPFEISDWTTFTFTSKDYIYQIDDEYWSFDDSPRTLDRSVQHQIKWQSVSYEKGNPVFSYTLPPKAEFISKVYDDKTVTYTPSVKGYRFTQESPFVCDTLTAQAFSGEDIKSSFLSAIYYDGVFQSYEWFDFSIDLKPPAPPLITSSSASSYSRSEVTVSVTGEEDAKLFCMVSSPLVSDSSSVSDLYEKALSLEYTAFDEKGITLSSLDRKATFYRIRAWAEDKSGNISALSILDLIVDQYNFYLSSSSNSEVCDGSFEHPFTDFSQAIQEASKNKGTCLHIIGDFTVYDDVIISSPLVLEAASSRLCFENGASLIVQGGSLQARNILFEKSASQGQAKPLVTCKDGTVLFDGCELSAVFEKEGILAQFENSSVTICNSGFTVQSASYGLCVSSYDTKTFIKDSRFTSVSSGAVGLSADGGYLEVQDSEVYVFGMLGRCVELVSSEAILKNNSFTSSLTSAKEASWIYCDKNAVIKKNEGNTFLEE